MALLGQVRKVGGRVLDAWRLIRELDLNGLRSRAEQPFKLLIVAPQRQLAEFVAALLTSRPADLAEAFEFWPAEDGLNADAAFVVVPEPAAWFDLQPTATVLRRILGAERVIVLLVGPQAGLPLADNGFQVVRAEELSREAVGAAVAPTLVRVDPDLAVAVGRRLEALRDPIARALIYQTAWANGEFAFLSNAPAVIPVVGPLLGGGADLFVLTKNQVFLWVRLALLYRRPFESPWPVLAELVPVVGGAFVWRSIAREMVGLVPPVVSAVPKTAIAYSATVFLGVAAEKYYRRHPELQQRLSALVLSLADRRRPVHG
jgi:uncharacterized protein (DUF697 family)